MSRTSDRRPLRELILTLALGVLMAAGLYVAAGSEVAWIGFALAATYRASTPGRACDARLARRARG